MKYFFYRLLGFFIGILPIPIFYTLAEKVGKTAYIFWGKRRKIGMENLKKAFPEKSNQELKIILEKTFINFSYTFFEIFKQPYVKNNIDNIFRVKGLENLETAYSDGKGVILVTAHFGNWELAGSFICSLGYKLGVIQKTQKNTDFDRLINYYRTLNNIKPIGRKTALKDGIKALKNGEILGIIADQKANTSGIISDFFGIPAKTTPLPARLYLKFKRPIVFVVPKRTGQMKFEVDFIEKYEPECDNIEEITQYINDRLESFIRQTPEQWFWPHNRWG